MHVNIHASALYIHAFISENRYLLFLTENYAALDILKHYLHVGGEGVDDQALTSQPYILFGSSFPKDKEYTQVGVLYENYMCVCALCAYCVHIVVNRVLYVEAGGVEMTVILYL